MAEVTALRDELTRFTVRAVQQMIAEAAPWWWLKRAEHLEEARPRPGDFHGRATPEELAARHARLTEAAAACREHAAFLAQYPDVLTEMMHADVQALAEGVSADEHAA